MTLGGTGKDKGKRHPTLGNNVLVGNGARILGPFTVGDNARVASGSVVLSAVPPNSTVVGVPAQVVKINGKPVENAYDCTDSVDQVHISDPVEDEIGVLTARIRELEADLAACRRRHPDHVLHRRDADFCRCDEDAAEHTEERTKE